MLISPFRQLTKFGKTAFKFGSALEANEICFLITHDRFDLLRGILYGKHIDKSHCSLLTIVTQTNIYCHVVVLIQIKLIIWDGIGHYVFIFLHTSEREEASHGRTRTDMERSPILISVNTKCKVVCIV